MKRLKPKEVQSLEGLTLTEQKILALHFSPKRTDCVTLGYEYDIDIDRVYLADEDQPVQLTSELNELTWFDLAKEYGLEIPDCKAFVQNKLKEALREKIK